MNSVIEKAGLLLTDEQDRILLCRKSRGTSLLILPGGRIEPGESPEQTLAREIREELSSNLLNPAPIGVYEDQAAGEPGKIVRVLLYSGALTSPPVASSEIAELVWFGPTGSRADLAPSIANKILPDLLARRILRWPT